jgi:hypothetical protein
MYDPEIVELVNASRAMLDGKNWHEIDGSCSICIRFRKAVEIAENAAEQDMQSNACLACDGVGSMKLFGFITLNCSTCHGTGKHPVT